MLAQVLGQLHTVSMVRRDTEVGGKSVRHGGHSSSNTGISFGSMVSIKSDNHALLEWHF